MFWKKNLGEAKTHYKLYKSGKNWLVMGVTLFSFGFGTFVTSQDVLADTSATNNSDVRETTKMADNASTEVLASSSVAKGSDTNIKSSSIASADTNENSWMPDINLQKAVLNELRSEKIIPSSSTTFTQNDLAKMQTLAINTNQPNDLDGLQYATNLTSLRVANNGTSNGISSLAPLANLTNLQKIDLDNNLITDLSPLTKLTSLTELHLSSNNISDIQPLSGLTNLAYLDLGYNKLSDNSTSLFKSLTNLSYLKISGNDLLTNLDNLNNLTNLSKFYASFLPHLTNISGLKNSTNLSSVEMSNDDIDDISVFKGFTKLNVVALNNNHISDLSPLNESFNGDIVPQSTGVGSTNLSVRNQTVTLNAVPIDYNGQKVTVLNGAWSVKNDSYSYQFSGTTNLPDTNKQSISASDYTTYVGAVKPTATDFKASATDKDGNDSSVTVDLSKADLTKAGVSLSR
uniref:leucine-rich repeat domain-containing protein n=1 Tax=Lacticaseibacillus paracasei TaxID=1597 RepID=UPI00403F472D